MKQPPDPLSLVGMLMNSPRLTPLDEARERERERERKRKRTPESRAATRERMRLMRAK